MKLGKYSTYAILLSTLGCGKDLTSTVKLPIGVELDPEFSQAQQLTIKNDIDWLAGFEMPRREMNAPRGQPHISRWFEDIFGGSSSQHILDFIDERSAYYAAPEREMIYTRYVRPLTAESSSVAEMLAVNLGVNLFVESLARRTPLYFEFDGARIRADDSRVGLVQIFKPHFSGNFRGKGTGEMVRMNTLVHESRHSDCTGGLKRSTLINLQAGVELVSNECAHLHAICPKGNLAGLAACDTSPWGAYAVSAVYFARMAQCEDCSEEFIQAALVGTSAMAERILPSDRLFGGSMGMPDMTSTPRMIEDVR